MKKILRFECRECTDEPCIIAVTYTDNSCREVHAPVYCAVYGIPIVTWELITANDHTNTHKNPINKRFDKIEKAIADLSAEFRTHQHGGKI